ncbi:MAG: DUF2378 family protein [Candidatus Paceibacterota bacterium]
MEEAPRPTIRGMFVRSHIKSLESVRGTAGLNELQKRFGRPVNYSSGDHVPIADEVKILEHIAEMVSSRPLSREEREEEAGKLHFRNFTQTPLWNLLRPIIGVNQKFVLMQSARIAHYVFHNVEFISQDLGGNNVKITLFNNDYPLAHFKGFFKEWLLYAGLRGTVEATAHTRGRYEYAISWL